MNYYVFNVKYRKSVHGNEGPYADVWMGEAETIKEAVANLIQAWGITHLVSISDIYVEPYDPETDFELIALRESAKLSASTNTSQS